MDNLKYEAETIRVPTRITTSGRITESSVEFVLSSWAPQSLFRVALFSQLTTWSLVPATHSRTRDLLNAMRCLGEDSTKSLNRGVADLTSEDVVSILQQIDDHFAVPTLDSEITAKKYFSAIRAVLVRAPGRLKDGLTVAHAASTYAAKKRRWRKPVLPANSLPTEIGHIGHTDLLDLRRQAEKSLRQRKDTIEGAAKSEIEAYEDTYAYQVALMAIELPDQIAAEVDDWITVKRAKDDRLLPSCTPNQFVAVVLRRLAENPPKLRSNGWPLGLRLPKSSLPWSTLPQAEQYRHQFSMWPWFFVQQRLPTPVLTAIFILLLSHTGWNQGSIGSLTIENITPLPQGGYRLQGYKGKTDDDTPVSEIPRYMSAHCKAVELLLWNYRQLEQLGLIDGATEKRIWFGWQLDEFKTTTHVVSDKRIDRFCVRHRIERFQPSELRPIKAALTYLPQRDLEAVRVLLGHVDLVTSSSYLENTLFFRLNEAMILEFQRRIEATLTYAEGGEALLIRRALPVRDVDKGLFLVPTGDGGACTNIQDGPNSTMRQDEEPCEALACHSGLGCKHYRLMVNETTIEMALRSQLYYRSRWQLLYEQNRIAFSDLHLPRMLYMHVLLKLVLQQRPDIYAKAERAVQ